MAGIPWPDGSRLGHDQALRVRAMQLPHRLKRPSQKSPAKHQHPHFDRRLRSFETQYLRLPSVLYDDQGDAFPF